ncbi:hypothetical protein [Cerasicoccus frondis]|uniref:hypothetical protein n=1 Tax=Cerasicoccus frondis TaxID=490090 RepID=UPI0028527B1B|nr:hypothetical protein [Cerasicoccus frondis]
MKKSACPVPKIVIILMVVYGFGSLIHFIHNAEFLESYPNLPSSWTPSGVYMAWVGLTCVGALGLFVLSKGYRWAGLLILMVYAALGVDSLGHYFVAELCEHTLGMNITIFMEVIPAAMLLFAVVGMLMQDLARKVSTRIGNAV